MLHFKSYYPSLLFWGIKPAPLCRVPLWETCAGPVQPELRGTTACLGVQLQAHRAFRPDSAITIKGDSVASKEGEKK